MLSKIIDSNLTLLLQGDQVNPFKGQVTLPLEKTGLTQAVTRLGVSYLTGLVRLAGARPQLSTY